jgi:hypothetical protein
VPGEERADPGELSPALLNCETQLDRDVIKAAVNDLVNKGCFSSEDKYQDAMPANMVRAGGILVSDIHPTDASTQRPNPHYGKDV